MVEAMSDTVLHRTLERAVAHAIKDGVDTREILSALVTLSAAVAYSAEVDFGEVVRELQRELDKVLELRDKIAAMGSQLVIGFKDKT